MLKSFKTYIISGLIASTAIAGSLAAQAEETYVPVISKGFQHEFWLAVKRGTEDAAKELGYKSDYVGPASETMVDQQVNMVENAIQKQPTAILLAALDAQALIPVTEKARSKNIPMVTFDSNVDSDYPSSFIATDNYAAGALAAQAMGKELGGKGTVAIVGHNAGTTSVIGRTEGFIKGIKENYPDIKLLDIVYTDADPQKVLDRTLNIIRSQKDLKGIYATNEGTTLGISLAVKNMGREDLGVVGFDSSDAIVNYLKDGILDAFVVQDPYQIGYQSMMTISKVLKGESVEKVQNIDAVLITKDNSADPAIQKKLFPLE
ncbi:MAG: ABC transporter substrate-binding protein [Alphaproteobacteria bacterium]